MSPAGNGWLRIDLEALEAGRAETARTLVAAADDAARAVRIGQLLYYPFADCDAARALLHARYGLPLSTMTVVADL